MIRAPALLVAPVLAPLVALLVAPFVAPFVAPGATPAAALTVTDSRGERTFDAPPERVVVLSWSLAEQVIELGVAPVGVADPEGYATWVARPPLPGGVAGVGLRQEPNLERIAELGPDVILASDDQISFAPALERIAPVLHFETYSAGHDNQAAARRTFLTLGRLFGREALAEEKLAALDARLAALRQKVQAHFGGDPPPVTVIRFVDTARVVLHGRNSMPAFALAALGLENATPLPPSKWGIAFRKVEELGHLTDGIVLSIEPFPQADQLFSTPLWQAMPFVQEGRFRALPPVWTYGGAMSVGYLAEAIADALTAEGGQ